MAARGILARAIVGLALVRLLLGGLGLVVTTLDPHPDEGGRVLPALLALSFGSVAALLLLGARRDDRATALGCAYLLTASQFGGLLGELPAGSTLAEVLRVVRRWDVAYFVPAFLWAFVSQFPSLRDEATTWAARASWATRASFALGGLFLLANAFDSSARAPAWLDDLADAGWGVVSLGVLSALVLSGWRSRAAPVSERRRVRRFLAGLGFGFGPLFLQLVLEAMIPAYDAWTSQADVLPWARGILLALLLSVPFTTGHAVLVERVLPVEVVLRRVLQYALARSTLLAVGSVPLLVLFAEVVLRRQDRVSDVVESPVFLGSALASVASALLLATRGGALAYVDQRFFRSQLEAERVLASVVQAAPRTPDSTALGQLLSREIDGALHPEAFAFFFSPRPGDSLRAVWGQAAELGASTTLAGLLSGDSEPLELDVDRPGSPLRRLPEHERSWLANSGLSLLVPVISPGGSLQGAIGLGQKKSELPYDRHDRELLRAVAASTALVLESQTTRNTSQPARPGSAGIDNVESEAPADECVACGLVQPASTGECLSCASPARAALLPRELRGKFLLEKRLGAGGMGVVYLARDLDLGRVVALKTLPRASEEAVRRLRREARAAATVSHPHLATVFGLESWSGIPFVVMEYLPGGSLGERLQRLGPLPIAEVLALAAALADGLETAHAAGILHRDIKPSNVAFTASKQPKLLDFGLARILGIPDSGAIGAPLDAAEDDTRALAPAPLTESGIVLGTPSYLSPEAARGLPPTPGFDLWSLGVLLYEVTSGLNPFARPTLRETLEAIAWPQPAPLDSLRPECPPALAALVADLLAADPKQRPGSATELRWRLGRIAAA